jgi:hypothetical protein
MKSRKLSEILKKATIFVAATSIISFYGCKAKPAEGQTDFIPKDKQAKLKDGKLVNKSWAKDGLDITKYNKVIVVPVFTEHQLERSWLERNNERSLIGSDQKDLEDFAKYIENAFKKAIKKSTKIKLATKPGPNTLILELAAVKVVPGKPIFQGIGNVTNLTPFGLILMPFKTTAQATSDSSLQSSVAVEGIIRNSETKEPIVIFADRKKQKSAIFNVNDFRAYSNLKQIVDKWADQFVHVMETGSGEGAKEHMIFVPINY